MTMIAEYGQRFAALRRYWWHLQMSEKFSNGTKKPKQTKQIQETAREVPSVLALVILKPEFYQIYPQC